MPDGFTMTDAADTPATEGRTKGPVQRDKIVQAIMAAGVTFWRDLDGDAFANVPGQAGQIARYRVKASTFKAVVRGIYGRSNPRTIGTITVPGSVSDTAMGEALCQLEAMALDGPSVETGIRVLGSDGAAWLDLGCARWRMVRTDADGWHMLDGVDVPLIRTSAMRALPEPVRDPDALATLRRLVNVASDDDFRLMVAWLVAALHPTGPYAVLALDGEQGSAKSTTCEMLRKLIDPNKANLRAPPGKGKEADLIVSAQSSRVIALDNVSFIETDIADALCRLATGGGMSKRRLYTDGEEHIINCARPVLLNGIPSLLARADLADRSLALTLPTIPEERRRTTVDVSAEFEAAAPGILALLLDGLAMALRLLPTITLPTLPRMADFAKLACAAAPAFGWTDADMLRAMESNRRDAVQAVIEADPVATQVRDLIATSGAWRGTASDLLVRLNERAPPSLQRETGWPKDGTRLSNRLKRAAPAMRRMGFAVTLPAQGGRTGRVITIESVPESPAERCGNAAERWPENQRSRVGVKIVNENSGLEAAEHPPERWNAGNANSPLLPGSVSEIGEVEL